MKWQSCRRLGNSSCSASTMWLPVDQLKAYPAPKVRSALPFTTFHCRSFNFHCLPLLAFSLPFLDLSLPFIDLALPSSTLYYLHCP